MFFYLHIKKAGGQSMRSFLKDVYRETNRFNPKPFIALPKEEWNDNLNNYRIPLGEFTFQRTLFAKKFLYSQNEFEGMFKFTIVRNPYDRAVSCWKYITKYNSNSFKKLLKNNTKLISKNPFSLFNQKIQFQIFLESLPWYWKYPNRNLHSATHTAPIIPDISDENSQVILNFIGKLENINQDAYYIASQLNLENKHFPKVNSLNHQSANYQEFYNKTTRKLVEEYYGEDIEYFKYKFQ